MRLNIHALHQVLPNFSAADAIGNEVILIQETLQNLGLESDIFVEHSAPSTKARPFGDIFRIKPEKKALLYHFSIASGMPAKFAPLPLLKLVRYHNITPPNFFNQTTEAHARHACSLGRRQIPMLAVTADAVIADSAYNASEMRPYARSEPVVIPIFRDYLKLAQSQDDDSLKAELKASKRQSLLFIGRIAPNKCQHDLLILLHLAQSFIAKNLRLILVGSFFSEAYHRDLEKLAAAMGLSIGTKAGDGRDPDIIILHGLTDAAMATVYRHSRVFVSMSEHEGFGVPLVEAMHFGLPILAHEAAAVPETVGDAGIICKKDDWIDTLEKLKALLGNEDLRGQLREPMARRAQTLGLDTVRASFRTWMIQQFG